MVNLTVEERLKEITEVCQMQRNKLKLCRLTMREQGIGHLYPGSTVEYEENMKDSMALMNGGDVQQLYTAAKLHQFQFESASKKIKQLLGFIESKGIPAQELQDYMVENTKILADDNVSDTKEFRDGIKRQLARIEVDKKDPNHWLNILEDDNLRLTPLKMEGEPLFDNAIEQEEHYKEENNLQTQSLEDGSNKRR